VRSHPDLFVGQDSLDYSMAGVERVIARWRYWSIAVAIGCGGSAANGCCTPRFSISPLWYSIARFHRPAALWAAWWAAWILVVPAECCPWRPAALLLCLPPDPVYEFLPALGRWQRAGSLPQEVVALAAWSAVYPTVSEGCLKKRLKGFRMEKEAAAGPGCLCWSSGRSAAWPCSATR